MHHPDANEPRSERARTMMEKIAIVSDIERRKREDGVSFHFSALKFHDISRRTWERYRSDVQAFRLQPQPTLPFSDWAKGGKVRPGIAERATAAKPRRHTQD